MKGSTFLLAVDLVKAPAAGYIGVQTEILYGSLVYKPTATADSEYVWPEATFAIRSPGAPTGMEGLVIHANGQTLIGPSISHYEGNLVEITLNCTAGNSAGHVIELVPVSATNTGASHLNVDSITTVPLSDSIAVDCIQQPPPTPTPPPQPTPASVGGVSFRPPGAATGAGGVVDGTALLVLTTGAVALTAAWYARRRVRSRRHIDDRF